MAASSSQPDPTRRVLYAGSRATFVERRKELARASRSGGERDEAKCIEALRKPTAAAHLVNLLAQADDTSLGELVELGASIRRAMAAGEDREVRSLLQRRTAAIANVVAQARAIAGVAGESVSGAVGDQILQTLRAAMGSDDAAAAVRSGTLSDALDEPGFGGFEIVSSERATLPKISGAGKARPNAEVAVDRKASEAAERAAAQSRIKVAAAHLKCAEKALAVTTKRRDVLERERDRLASQLAQIEDELAAAEVEVDDVEAQLNDATVELQAARSSSPG